MEDDFDLLDDLAEEETIEEVVTLEADNNPIRKIARILKTQKPDFDFDELERTDLPAMSLACYFAKDIDKDTMNNMITGDQGNIFQNILAFDEQDKNSLISRLIPGDSSLHILKEYQDKTRRAAEEQREVETAPNILQYTDIGIFASIAAQKLIELVPLLASHIEKINNPDDLKDMISYSQLVLSAKDEGLQRRLAEQAEDKDKNAGELINDGLKLFFAKDYPNYISMLHSIREGKKINKKDAQKALKELFGVNMPKYEQAAYLSELIDEPDIIKDLFSKLIVYIGAKRDLIIHQAFQPDFAALFRDIVTEYYKQKETKQKGKRNKFRDTQKKDYNDNAQVRLKKGSEDFEKYKGQLGTIGSCECGKTSKLLVEFEKETERTCFNIIDLETRVLMEKDLGEDGDEYIPEKLNYRGYENLCMELMLEDITEEIKRDLKVGDKVEVFGSGNEYNCSRDGSWGYVKKVIDNDEIAIEFHHFTGEQHETPEMFEIEKKYVKIIEPKDKKMYSTKSFEQIKKELENKSKIGEYINKDYKLQLISKKLDIIYG